MNPISPRLLLIGSTLIAALTLPGCGEEPRADATAVLPPQGPTFAERAATFSSEAPAPSTERRLEKKTDPAADTTARPALEEVPPPEVALEGGATKPARKDADGVLPLSFQKLASFEYETIDPLSMLQKSGEAKTDIPAEILALSEQQVKIDGFLMPTIFEGGKVERFLLTRSYITCCFGDVLNMNEVVDCTTGPKLEVSYFLSGQPVTVTGWFEVGEKKSEFGYVESIYRLVVDEVTERW